jgi:hypothetical protein
MRLSIKPKYVAEVARRYFIYVAICISIVILFKPGGDGPLPFPQADKVIHATTFALLALGLYWRQMKLRMIIMILLVYAAGSEIIQHFFIPGREFDLLDIVADSAGFALMLGLVGWKKDV